MTWREQPSGPAQCFNCGRETNDWDEISYRKVWVCGHQRCHNEIRDANRAAEEEAQMRAMEDGYDRYR